MMKEDRRGGAAARRPYLDGEAVGHHHDDQRDEEGHEGANQHEALLVEDTAAVDEDLVLVVKADHRDRHGDACKQTGAGVHITFRNTRDLL